MCFWTIWEPTGLRRSFESCAVLRGCHSQIEFLGSRGKLPTKVGNYLVRPRDICRSSWKDIRAAWFSDFLAGSYGYGERRTMVEHGFAENGR